MNDMNDKTKRFEMRVSDTFFKRLDEWRRLQEDLPSRADAVRRLVDAGLKKDSTHRNITD